MEAHVLEFAAGVLDAKRSSRRHQTAVSRRLAVLRDPLADVAPVTDPNPAVEMAAAPAAVTAGVIPAGPIGHPVNRSTAPVYGQSIVVDAMRCLSDRQCHCYRGNKERQQEEACSSKAVDHMAVAPHTEGKDKTPNSNTYCSHFDAGPPVSSGCLHPPSSLEKRMASRGFGPENYRQPPTQRSLT